MITRRMFVASLGALSAALSISGKKAEATAAASGGFAAVEFRRSDRSVLVRLPQHWCITDLQLAIAQFGHPESVWVDHATRRRILESARMTTAPVAMVQGAGTARDYFLIGDALTGSVLAVHVAHEQPNHVRLVYTSAVPDPVPSWR